MRDLFHTRDYEELSLKKQVEHTRAYIKVQDGCNQFCSYCIIPYTRGRARSRKKEQILEEIRSLGKEGYKEVVLTGIHLSSYGKDLEHTSLLDLIQEVSKMEEIRRIRLGSLEPNIITEEFVKALKDNEKFCPHFHLSLQSACNKTLRAMNRFYKVEDYLNQIENIKTKPLGKICLSFWEFLDLFSVKNRDLRFIKIQKRSHNKFGPESNKAKKIKLKIPKWREKFANFP